MKIKIPNQTEIINHYGVDNQLGIHMEECSELIQAISKCHRYNNAESRDHLIEEIADVIICIDQLKTIFNISNDDIQRVVNKKYARQINRLNNDK